MSSRWKSGQKSPNPKGRPKGTPDRRTRWRDTLRDETPALLAKLVELAHEGDLQALLAVLDRTAPRLRPQGETVTLPGLADAVSLSDQARIVVAGVAEGSLSTDAAGDLLGALANTAKLIEAETVSRRLDALEESASKRRHGKHRHD